MKYKDVMKCFSFLTILFAVFFLLIACDGSTELGNQSNVLFVVAFQDKIGLVDGETLFDESDASAQEGSLFTSKPLVEGTKGVAFDFSDRNQSSLREELFLLSRDANNQAYVSVFDMTEAKRANGDAAIVAKRDVIKVDVDLARAENVPAPSSFCVTDIQVSKSGRYIALVSNQRLCSSSSQESNAIDIIDIGSDLKAEPELVYHKDLIMNINESSQIFSYQDDTAERLFFLEGSGEQGTLRKLSIPEFEEETVLRNLDITNVIDMQAFGRPNDGEEELIIARAENYAIVTNYLSTATLESAVSYGETVQRIFPNPSNGRFLALTDDEFVVYETPALANKTSRFINAKDAFYVPVPQNDFVYVLSDRTISRYDPVKAFSDLPPTLDSFNVSGLEDVQLFSWLIREATVVTTP